MLTRRETITPSNFLDANLAYFRDHMDELVDPDLIAIDRNHLADLMSETTARAEWDDWTAAYRDLLAAVERDAPHLLPLLGRVCDAGGDLATASEAAGRNRGIALACAMRPPRTDPPELQIATWEAFEMFPLPGSVPNAEEVTAQVYARERRELAIPD